MSIPVPVACTGLAERNCPLGHERDEAPVAGVVQFPVTAAGFILLKIGELPRYCVAGHVGIDQQTLSVHWEVQAVA